MLKLKALVVPVTLLGIVGAGVVAEVPTSPAGAGEASSGESDAVARATRATSLTARAVSAAKAFKSSLSSSQRSALQFSFKSSSKQSGWSNVPPSVVARNGVEIADLDSTQRRRLRTLLKTILSSRGFRDEKAVREADAYLSQQPSGGPGGSTGTVYGESLYYVAFFGNPALSKKWTVQFGGHHLAIHITFAGSSISNTPYFIGVEPRAAFQVDGKTYQPLKDEAAALFGAVQSLSSSQLATAKLSRSFDNVLVGAQQDGQFPTRQGIRVSELSKAQQRLVTKAIWAYLGDMPTRQARARLKLYEEQYPGTKLAWSGSTDGTTSGSYARIHGPRVWIEIATTNSPVLRGTTHYHSIERDTETDYGAGS